MTAEISRVKNNPPLCLYLKHIGIEGRMTAIVRGDADVAYLYRTICLIGFHAINGKQLLLYVFMP